MKFLKKLTEKLGFGSHNNSPDTNNHAVNNTNNNLNSRNSDDFRRNSANAAPIPTGPRKGFSVPVQVPVERHVVGPILVPCNGNGGVQGLKWYETRLRVDDDGDVADEFLEEVLPDTSSTSEDQAKPVGRFQVKHSTVHAKIKQQALSSDGNLQHCVDYRGQLLWV